MIVTVYNDFAPEANVPFVKGVEYKGRAEYNIGNGVLTFFVTDSEGVIHEFTRRIFEMHFYGVVNPNFYNKF